MPAVAGVMAPGAQMVVLIKPQFEAGRSQVSSGGVVRDPQVRAAPRCRLGNDHTGPG
jgi:23S rRNA (cytidine1920-2'-O)/16S rRNA (cytidine1409-2'-O)-methyltransferase